MRYWIIGLVVVVLLVGGTSLAYQQGWVQRPGPKYLTLAVSRGRVETMVNSTGTVKPVRTVSVGAFTSGPISTVNVDFTDYVEADDSKPLALIDTRLLQAAVDRDRAYLKTQEAELERVEAILKQSENDLARVNLVVAKNPEYVSGTEMDERFFKVKTLKAQRALANASIDQAKATLTNSTAQLGYARITAPEAGFIIERKVDRGQTVAATFQTPELFTIAPEMDKRMHVYAAVDEADIGMVHAAQDKKKKAKFTVDAYPNDLFEGEVKQIRSNSTTTQNVVTYPVIIEVTFPPLPKGVKVRYEDLKLKPGMTANISFPVDVKEDVLRVPSIALRFQPTAAQVRPEDKHYIEAITAPVETGTRRSAGEKAAASKSRTKRVVWVQQDNDKLLRAIPVTLGLTETQFAEIVEGELTEGQKLVIGTEAAK